MMTSVARTALAAALLSLISIGAQAATQVLFEDFEDAFPAWEGRWLKQNSNAMNALCLYPNLGGCAYRGWPDGMILTTPDFVSGQLLNWRFNADFGKSIVNLEFDIAAVYKDPLKVYDSAGALIFSQIMAPTEGYMADPGIYEHFAIASTTGISRVEIGGRSASGMVIDNIAATVTISAVPEPGSWGLFAAGGLALVALSRRRGGRAV